MSTSALLQKKDFSYSLVTVAAAVVAIAAAVLFSFSQAAPFALGMSVCIGELVWMGGLIGIATDRRRFFKRLIFLAEISILFIIPFALKYFLGDKV
jgi:ABC-type cobalamin transport system permease subunit